MKFAVVTAVFCSVVGVFFGVCPKPTLGQIVFTLPSAILVTIWVWATVKTYLRRKSIPLLMVMVTVGLWSLFGVVEIMRRLSPE